MDLALYSAVPAGDSEGLVAQETQYLLKQYLAHQKAVAFERQASLRANENPTRAKGFSFGFSMAAHHKKSGKVKRDALLRVSAVNACLAAIMIQKQIRKHGLKYGEVPGCPVASLTPADRTSSPRVYGVYRG